VLECKEEVMEILAFILINPFPEESKAYFSEDLLDGELDIVTHEHKYKKRFYLYLLKEESNLHKLWNLFVKTLEYGILNKQKCILEIREIVNGFIEGLIEAGVSAKEIEMIE